MKKDLEGLKIYSWLKHLFPIHRSITGKGLRKTLNFFKKEFPKMKIQKIKSGTKVFDWVIPKEWEVKQAYISDLNGKKIVDYKNSNLHIVGYSNPINKTLSFAELNKHLYSIPKQPNAIPYITSYYNKTWGFCLKDKIRKKLNKKKNYKVYINSSFKSGYLNYGEIYLKGKSKKEIVFSTNVCHPSLGNNELSGPVLALALTKYLNKQNLFYSYRILFVPETIGALSFLKKNEKKLKKIKGGFVLSCLGDDDNYSILNSRYGNNFADKMAEFNYKYNNYSYNKFSYLKRGSDERQYCAPLFNLPFCTIMRTRFGDFKEYHTSFDNLNYVSSKGLGNSFKMLKKLIFMLEHNRTYISKIKGEPFLNKYNLKKEISGFNKPLQFETKTILDLVSYCDGEHDLIDISKIIRKDYLYLLKMSRKLCSLGILKELTK